MFLIHATSTYAGESKVFVFPHREDAEKSAFRHKFGGEWIFNFHRTLSCSTIHIEGA